MKRFLYPAIGVVLAIVFHVFFPDSATSTQGKRGGYPPSLRVLADVQISRGVMTQTDPRTKDPTKCTKVCTPEGYEGALPREFPEGVERVACAGDYCAKAHNEPPPEGDDEESCKPHFSCSVHCSEVCCVCLRECI